MNAEGGEYRSHPEGRSDSKFLDSCQAAVGPKATDARSQFLSVLCEVRKFRIFRADSVAPLGRKKGEIAIVSVRDIDRTSIRRSTSDFVDNN